MARKFAGLCLAAGLMMFAGCCHTDSSHCDTCAHHGQCCPQAAPIYDGYAPVPALQQVPTAPPAPAEPVPAPMTAPKAPPAR